MVQLAALLAVLYFGGKMLPYAFFAIGFLLPWTIGLIGWLMAGVALWALIADHNTHLNIAVIGLIGLGLIILAKGWLQTRDENGGFMGGAFNNL